MSDRQHHIERAEATKKLHDEIERLQSRIEELENTRLQVCKHLYISGSPKGINQVWCGSCKRDYLIPSKAFARDDDE